MAICIAIMARLNAHVAFLGQFPVGVLEAEALEMQVPHSLLWCSLEHEQLLQSGSHDLAPGHVLARTGPVAQRAGLSIQVPLPGLVE